MIILDTHVLWWLDQASPRLGEGARREIEQAESVGEVAVSAISFWELEVLVRRGRLRAPWPLQQWRRDLMDAGLVEIPLTADIAVYADQLTLPHRDPADRFIVATALLREATLVTADKTLLNWPGELTRIDAEC